MEKTVTFSKWQSQRNFNNDSFECSVAFSVIDSALAGTPREQESIHTIRIIMTDSLMDAWRLAGAVDFNVTDDMVKVALQALEEHLTDLLRRGLVTERNLPPLFFNTQNSPRTNPYKLSNIRYPDKKSFSVVIDERADATDFALIHPNFKVLLDRMDDAMSRGDYSGVLLASASMFETMAKDVVRAPNVQNQTLKGFFAKYRKESLLPEEILDYILAIYETRNTTPLAGHGSTQTPSLNKETAIVLYEMTKAFIRLEYKLREK